MNIMKKQIRVLIFALFLVVFTAFSGEWKHLRPTVGPTIVTNITSLGIYQFALVVETSHIKTIYKRTSGNRLWYRILSDTASSSFANFRGNLETAGGKVFYRGSENNQQSADFGRRWTDLSFDPSKTVFFGDTLLRIYRTQISEDGGRSWNRLSSDFYSGPVNCITYGESKAYIGGWGGIAVLESDLQWSFLDNGLPERENITAIGKLNDSVLIASTELALYHSKDGGSSWGLLDSTISIPFSVTGEKHFAVSENVHYMSTETDIYELANDGSIKRKLDTGFRRYHSGISVFEDTLYTSGYDGVYKYLKSSDSWELTNFGIDRSNIITEAFVSGEEFFVTSVTGLYTPGSIASGYRPMYSSVFALDQLSGEWRIVLEEDFLVSGFAVIGDKYFAALRCPDSEKTIKLVSENRGDSWEDSDFPDLSPHNISVYGDTVYSWNKGILRSTNEFSSWDTITVPRSNTRIEEFVALDNTLIYGWLGKGSRITVGGITISHDGGETLDDLTDRTRQFAYSEGKLIFEYHDTLHISHDSGLTWDAITRSGEKYDINGFTSCGIVFGRHSHFSLDRGATWEPIIGPDGNLTTIRTFRLYNDMMYSIDNGVFYAKPASSLGTTLSSEGPKVYSRATVSDIFHTINGNILSLRLNIPQRETNYHISLHDLKGAVVMKKAGTLSYGKNIIDLDCSGISNAIYLLNIRTGNKHHARRVVIGP
ncbi:T9SS type A sorting domain-containing protein [Chitinispirillales bacterium ANBcel5]|uniref:T9SS type A sorting domain-containing protein n=1 Tax=Cellulosispirillum alkaliphilum TaxID=3039283 RepID=UPI002A573B85|nr:T9SS type A sorting domain-containing protein [Chitinispirillales bacterium ANBcel5]